MYATQTGCPQRSFRVVLHADRVRRRWLRMLWRTLWWAESTDALGWYVVGDTEKEVRGLVIDSLRFRTQDDLSTFVVYYARACALDEKLRPPTDGI